MVPVLVRQSCGTCRFVDSAAVAAPGIDAGYGFAPAVFRVVVTEQDYANTDMCHWWMVGSGIRHWFLSVDLCHVQYLYGQAGPNASHGDLNDYRPETHAHPLLEYHRCQSLVRNDQVRGVSCRSQAVTCRGL